MDRNVKNGEVQLAITSDTNLPWVIAISQLASSLLILIAYYLCAVAICSPVKQLNELIHTTL